MKTSQTSLKSFEQIARERGLSILAVGGLLLGVWLGGHGALYGAYRVTGADAPTVVAQAD
jgi:hypothetical protein